MILTATLVIVLVTVIVGGGSTVTLLTWLGIPLGLNEDADDRHQLDNGGEQRQTRRRSDTGHRC